MAQSDTKSILSLRQVIVLETLMNRGIGESLEALATRAGVSRSTLHRYLRQTDFHAEYRARVILEFGGQRGGVARALVEGATTPGPGQAAMQRIYWQLNGMLTDSLEIAGQGGGPIKVSGSSNGNVAQLSALSLETKRSIVRDLVAAGVEFIDLASEA